MMQLRALIDQVDYIALVDPGVGRVYTKITITPEDLRALGQAPTKYDGPSGHLTGEEYRQLIGQSQTPATSRPEQPHELPTPEVGSIVCFTPPCSSSKKKKKTTYRQPLLARALVVSTGHELCRLSKVCLTLGRLPSGPPRIGIRQEDSSRQEKGCNQHYGRRDCSR